MYPFIELWGLKLYMTWLWIVISLVIFIFSVRYLTKKMNKDFYSFFYRVPILLIFVYLLGVYFQFVFDYQMVIPSSWSQLLDMLNPYGYNFSFIGVVLWYFISIYVFIAWIDKQENKKMRIDILFFSTVISLIPLGVFMLLWDDVIGKSTEWIFAIKALHPDSNLNKFQWVYPIWAFISIISLLTLAIVYFVRQKVKKFGIGLLGFSLLLFFVNIILQFQSYPRFWVVSFGEITLDVKNYISFLIIMICMYIYIWWNSKNK